jgi:hypothetical protein
MSNGASVPSELNIRILNEDQGYESSLMLLIIRTLSPVPVVFDWASRPHLEIRGANRPWRPRRARAADKLKRITGGPAKVVLFHTTENARYEPADFTIGFDLGVTDERHFRMPLWWTSIDWSRQGVRNVPTPRIRKLIDIETLMRPLSEGVLQRPRKAAFFTTHMLQPRETIFSELSQAIEIDGYGPYFDSRIAHHNSGSIFKDDILQGYMFNLCPENSMYPGYYTEKVPEAFGCGCIPITWADQNIAREFNQGAFINLADFAATGYREGFKRELRAESLARLVSTPLLHKAPDFANLLLFVQKIIDQALR